MRRPDTDPCPCGGPLDYARCCARWHGGEAAADAETLMRSRYSAYVLGHADYLLATWHASTRPDHLDLDAEPRPKWLGLEVKRHRVMGANEAIVEFVARYRVAGRGQRMHETSRFVREAGRWYYVEGEVR
jgi:SEC-C motif domain protein